MHGKPAYEFLLALKRLFARQYDLCEPYEDPKYWLCSYHLIADNSVVMILSKPCYVLERPYGIL